MFANQSPTRLRVLMVTELFPNRVEPSFAIYNKLQAQALGAFCDVDVHAVIPWFPGVARVAAASTAGRFAQLPDEELIDGLRVHHPRILYVPKLGQPVSPALYALSLWPHLRSLRGQFDVLWTCWAYPDGVAAVMLGKALGVPVVLKVHGSDLNVLPRNPVLRTIMKRVLPAVDRLVAVSRPLGDRAIELGVAAERVVVIRNGMDRQTFRPRDRALARASLGRAADESLILYVGRLDPAKGLLDLIDAFERLVAREPRAVLAIVGGGPARAACEAAVARHPGRVILTGPQPMDVVAQWMAACNVLALPSWNEGTPNVVLEAFACGRRVVATNVGGIPDVVTSPALGEMVSPRDVAALTGALGRALAAPEDEAALVAAAPQSWRENAEQLHAVLQAAAHRTRPS